MKMITDEGQIARAEYARVLQQSRDPAVQDAEDESEKLSLFDLHQMIGGLTRQQRRVFLSKLRKQRNKTSKKKSGQIRH